LHSQTPPILHRDIKPANIKLTPNGPLKLVDFGLVKIMAPEDNRTITVLQGKGTVQYTPMEQYGGDTGHTDVRSDIYSLAATLYHLLTLQPPIEAKERFLYPENTLSLREINPAISSRTEQALIHALSMHPNDRPKDVKSFKKELLGDGIFTANSKSSAWWGRNLQTAIIEHRTLLSLVGLLLALAIIITTFAPQLPPAN